MKKIITAISFVFMPCNIFSQSTATITDTIEISTNVPVYEYVPKVIIEGKWGTGPGEFGYDGFYIEAGYEGASINEIFVPKSALFGPDDLIYPRSLAVDSKGNIYILDIVNNRIQKFDSAGNFLKAVKVESWTGYKLRGGDLEGYTYEVKGINIVIDSKDNLYYYLLKRMKDGKETGEALLRQGYEGQVWHFRNDKLVKKMKQGEEKIDKGYKSFQVRKNSNKDTEIIFEFENNKIFKFTPRLARKISTNKKIGSKVQQPKLTKDLVIFLTYNKSDDPSDFNLTDRASYVYDKKGNLKWVTAGVIPGEIDNEGNGYVMDINDTSVVVQKYEKVRVSK